MTFFGDPPHVKVPPATADHCLPKDHLPPLQRGFLKPDDWTGRIGYAEQSIGVSSVRLSEGMAHKKKGSKKGNTAASGASKPQPAAAEANGEPHSYKEAVTSNLDINGSGKCR
jgi:hypothetical protein